MSRIIGGVAGGRRLRAPKGVLTRPTTDRVREALFSAVESALGSWEGLRFLDLYAGSGAVGLEARSRGAAVVTLVERDRRTAGLIRDNARAVGLADVEVVCAPVARHLAATTAAGDPAGGRAPSPGPSPAAPSAYDVVFLDPPYDLPADEVRANLVALGQGGWLAERAVVVVERSTRDRDLPWPAGYEPRRVRSYGETTLRFASWVGR